MNDFFGSFSKKNHEIKSGCTTCSNSIQWSLVTCKCCTGLPSTSANGFKTYLAIILFEFFSRYSPFEFLVTPCWGRQHYQWALGKGRWTQDLLSVHSNYFVASFLKNALTNRPKSFAPYRKRKRKDTHEWYWRRVKIKFSSVLPSYMLLFSENEDFFCDKTLPFHQPVFRLKNSQGLSLF